MPSLDALSQPWVSSCLLLPVPKFMETGAVEDQCTPDVAVIRTQGLKVRVVLMLGGGNEGKGRVGWCSPGQ